ncbi:MAG: hypothetical protein IPJ49_05390 [Candidatus Obscuribacter sp.]|nr:hypothetical protein [Candidatus Obscuribacter sp.]
MLHPLTRSKSNTPRFTQERFAASLGRGIDTGFGINPAHLSGRHNACPICGGSDRFRFDDQEGDGTFYCNQCGAGDGFKLLMLLKGIGFGAVLDLLDGNRTELEQLTSVSVKRSAPISETNLSVRSSRCIEHF